MNDIALTPEYLEHLLALGKAVPAGPWGTRLNAFELFGKDFTDWGEVYANLTLDNGHVFKGSVIAHANTNLIPEEEKLAAREAHLKGQKVDPGLSGKIAAYIAAYHPGVTTALILEILRLRKELATMKCRVCEADAPAARTCEELLNLEHRLEIYDLEYMRLESAAHWLAEKVREGCPPIPPEYLPDCDNENHPHNCASCWVEAARKITEKSFEHEGEYE